ncbi:hypothetical protein VPNG_04137 [Cytospora leucostoma]|uniref:BTB domain-containing protein n=1 Tax=Cytospora leucostoma TaxID=1230097 RepID=A0A423XD57_9PEZI|nr:hypothetical protein VPNG_04137 [Cytospora leucostoma]
MSEPMENTEQNHAVASTSNSGPVVALLDHVGNLDATTMPEPMENIQQNHAGAPTSNSDPVAAVVGHIENLAAVTMPEPMEDTQQDHAVASTSNSDPVAAVVGHIEGLGLDGSSSPVLSTATTEHGGDAESATTGGTKDEDTTLMIKDDEDEEAKPVVFLDKNGMACTDNTPFNQFNYFTEYVQFCENGPKFKIRLAVHDDHGTVVRFATIDEPKKLLKDFGAYFNGLDRTNMLEASKGYVDLDDVDYRSFLHLMAVIRNGAPSLGINLGPKNRTMSILLEVYILADRFIMPLVKAWVATAMADYMAGHRHWANAYQHDVIDHAIPGAEADHQELLMDFNDIWTRVTLLPSANRPVQKDAILELLLNCCPRMLLCDTLQRMHPGIVRSICVALLSG